MFSTKRLTAAWGVCASRKARSFVFLFIAIVTLAEESPSQGQPPAYEGELHSMAAINIRDAELSRTITGLNEPWAIEFITADEILVTEIRGRLLRIRLDNEGERAEIAGLPPIATERQQTGLLDVALHPRFERNRRIYFSYAEADRETGRYYRTQLASAILAGNQLNDLTRLLDDGIHGWSPSNFGGAIAFDQEGHLLVSIGDRSEEVLAQRGDRLEGKVLRLNDDGTVPDDNPFIDDPDVDDRIFALGIRNAQGLDRDPETGVVYFAEHGPLGGDEVNILRKGANYGWPKITYGRNYSTAPMGEGTHKPGYEQPLFYYLPSEAISPLLLVRGGPFPEWDGDLLIGTLKGKHISRLDLDGDVVRSEYPILGEINSRIRDLKQGPEGTIYILTQDGDLLRLTRTGEAGLAQSTGDGKAVYEQVCAGCHDTGAAGAPALIDSCRWKSIANQPIEQTYRNTFEGIGEMPERGLCFICNDDHLKRAVDYMLEAASACADEG
ncbi:MAG: PQQ-dependent sugar dehydrogenase [Wenzhouxiangellaceae bacterium]